MIACLPKAWHSNRECLKTGFKDVARAAKPDLIKELPQFWPEGTLLARAAKRRRPYFGVDS
jgi:hypothetical protein